MSLASAAFFAWVQGAPFYQDVHGAAVELLPRGEHKSWLDVGCGPGLVTRLASARGYRARGIDRDPAMIRVARRLDCGALCEFEVEDLSTRDDRSFDVVSAASLLILLDDPRAGAEHLWSRVAPGGTLLVVETTPKMTPHNADAMIATLPPGRRSVLSRWAAVRRGRAVDPSVFDGLDASRRHEQPLLGGLVCAWTLTRP